MPDLSKTAPEQRGMPKLLGAPALCGPRPADRNLHTIWSEVKMPCLRAGRANGHAQSGSELYAILPISEVYRDALGRVSVAGSPARREPWRAPAVEDGIGARDRAPSLAGSSHAYDRCRRPADPDHARRPPRRGRAA